MRLQCPNCLCDLDVIAADQTVEVKCPSCGSQVDVSSHAETQAYVAPQLGRLGPFELVAHIGRGHFGDVYKARDSRLERLVAVKVPRTADLVPAARQAFFREARTAARLRHANIVTVHEVNTAGETIYIASELIDGVNLADLIAARKFEPRRAAKLVAQVADALHHAHEQDVVHRDLKPRNIMLDERDEPHLLDFGLAKQSASEFTITSEGDILGTPAYMAPEQARGQAGSADRRTDVYSLGVTLYEMLTGQRPFAGEVRGLIFQILHEDPRPPRKLEPAIPRDLETICLKAMAKRPDARYATAADMASDLRSYLAGEPIRARRAGVVERTVRWCQRNPALSLSSGVATLAVALLIGLQLFRSPAVGQAAALSSAPVEAPKAVELTVLKRDGSLPGSPTSPAEELRAAFWLLDPTTGTPVFEQVQRFVGASPATAQLLPGDYLVVVVIPNHGFHEVFRHVPRRGDGLPGGYKHQWSTTNPAGVVTWPEVEVPSVAVESGMVRYDGMDRVPIGSDALGSASPHSRRVTPFLVDPYEVTIGEFAANWTLPTSLQANLQPPSHPIRGIQWNMAAGYAEKMGKRLLDEFEYEVAATDYGRRRFPWGDNDRPTGDWSLGPVGAVSYDQTNTIPAVFGLYSGAAEWTSSWAVPYPRERDLGLTNPTVRLERVVRGAPLSVIQEGKLSGQEIIDPRNRAVFSIPVSPPGLGLRCARSAQPRVQPEDFGGELRSDE